LDGLGREGRMMVDDGWVEKTDTLVVTLRVSLGAG
jgi:hypothetical protein